MKNHFFPVLVLLLFLLLTVPSACSAPEDEKAQEIDTTQVSLLAQERFEEVFSQAQDLKIKEKSVYVQNRDPDHVVIVFSYGSGDGEGNYGLEYRGNPQDGYRLLQEGEDVTGKLVL